MSTSNGASSARNAVIWLAERSKQATRGSIENGVQYGAQNAAKLHTFAWFAKDRPEDAWRIAKSFFRRHVLTLGTLLIVIWFFALHLGETGAFNTSIEKCDWRYWEAWPEGAAPHHLVFVADPQLVDPHTYVGRPWPLNSLTFAQTDAYIRKSYSRIQRTLDPHSILFLGDLFDGGREWATLHSQSPDKRWQRYGNDFWQREFDRFSKIFFTDWRKDLEAKVQGDELETQDHIRVLASLPGNHDLGFSTGIQKPVRDRFMAYFGDSNRIDILGNHTFVSIDTVSLSAKDAESEQNAEEIWRETDHFLNNVEFNIARKTGQYLQITNDIKLKHARRDHIVEDIEHLFVRDPKPPPEPFILADFPVILLTHVPLFRNPGTPCGPLRERHPPTKPPPGQTEPVDPDPPNSINSLGAGIQYQNSVSRPLSLSIIERLGAKVEHVFSGDDHDYCDVVHRAYPSPGHGIREITVKSISWAMGVRKPGFLLVSLWNEVDPNGKRVHFAQTGDQSTIQTHLCLLPDQLAILIRYAILLAISLFALLIRSIITIYLPSKLPLSSSKSHPTPLLPMQTFSSTSHQSDASSSTTNPKLKTEDAPSHHHHHQSSNGTSNSTSSPHVSGSSSFSDDAASSRLSARNTNASSRSPRSTSPVPSYGYGYGLGISAPPPPPSQGKTKQSWDGTKDKGDDGAGMYGRRRSAHARKQGKLEQMLRHWAGSVLRVGVVVVWWYVHLLRSS